MNDPVMVLKMIIWPALLESLYMTLWGTVFSCILGFGIAIVLVLTSEDGLSPHKWIYRLLKYSLQGTTQGRYLTGGVPPVRFSM